MPNEVWIPIEMAVPMERDTYCLVTVQWKFHEETALEVYSDIWGAIPDGGTGWQLTSEFEGETCSRKVLAWMPYPEPFIPEPREAGDL